MNFSLLLLVISFLVGAVSLASSLINAMSPSMNGHDYHPASMMYLNNQNYTHYLPIYESGHDHSGGGGGGMMSSSSSSSMEMESTPSLELYWMSKPESSSGKTILSFAVAVPNENIGWIALGIAEPTSTMPGSDIGVATISSTDGSATWNDYYATTYSMPSLDNCGPSDWFPSSSSKNENYTIVEGWRYFEARDPDADRPISTALEGITHFIFAFGSQSSLSYHGNNAFEKHIELFGNDTLLSMYNENHHENNDDHNNMTMNSSSSSPSSPSSSSSSRAKKDNPMENAGYDYFWIGMSNHPVPTKQTSYDDSPCVAVGNHFFPETGDSTIGFPGFVTNQSNITTPSYLVGFASDLDEVSSSYVHHMVVKGWRKSPTCDRKKDRSIDIFGTASDPNTYFEFPSVAALNTSRFVAFSIEFHYNNPALDTGKVDSSGIRIYFTRTPRQHMASIMQFGDPAVLTSPNNIPSGVWQRYTYECPSSVTNYWPLPEVTAFASFQHMHENGRMFKTTYAHSNGTVYRTVKADFFDFHGQHFVRFNDPFVIKRGDIVTTSGTMHATTPGTVFGLGTENEMIIDFVMVYPEMYDPIVPSLYCGFGMGAELIGNETFTSESQLGRTFGTGVCPTTTTTTTSIPTSTSTTTAMMATSTTTTQEETQQQQTTIAPATITTTSTVTTATSVPPPTTTTITSTATSSPQEQTSSTPTTTTSTTSSPAPTTAVPSSTTTSTALPPTTTTTSTPPSTTPSTTSETQRNTLYITLSSSNTESLNTIVQNLAQQLGIATSDINATETANGQIQVNFIQSSSSNNNQLIETALSFSSSDLSSLGFSSVSTSPSNNNNVVTTTTMMNSPATTTTSSTNNGGGAAPSSDSSSSLSGGEVAGVVVGCIIGAILVLVVIGFILKKKQHPQHVQYNSYMQDSYDSPTTEFEKRNSGSDEGNNNNGNGGGGGHVFFTPKHGGDENMVSMSNLMAIPSSNQNNINNNSNALDDDLLGQPSNNKNNKNQVRAEKQAWKRKMDI